MQLLNSKILSNDKNTRYSNKKAQDTQYLVLFVCCSFFVQQRWRKRGDSLRDIQIIACFNLILFLRSFFVTMSLSRRGCKQPFHRLFGRLVISKKTGILYEPTSNPFESHDWRKKIRIHFKCIRILWRKEWDSNPRYVAVYLISSQGRYDHFDIFP